MPSAEFEAARRYEQQVIEGQAEVQAVKSAILNAASKMKKIEDVWLILPDLCQIDPRITRISVTEGKRDEVIVFVETQDGREISITIDSKEVEAGLNQAL